MAKRVMDRRALRAQAEAAERLEGAAEGYVTDTQVGDDAAGPGEEKKPAKVKEKSAKPRKPRARAAKTPIRMRVMWRVFNNSNQPIATYEYPRRAEADAHAARLTTEKKITHFVMPVKEPIETAE
jgi:hypothetical protein